MSRVVSIGRQDYATAKQNNNFLVDKTRFIQDWWESDDQVTLIARPRRFGKTFNMSMLNSFFSLAYAGRSDLFADMKVWKSEKMRGLQGTFPVINLTFSSIKTRTFESCRTQINEALAKLYSAFRKEVYPTLQNDGERMQYDSVRISMGADTAQTSLQNLSLYLHRCCGKAPIILLDEYDTPMQEAWLAGYWDDIVSFFRGFFNYTFKNNPWLEKAVMTGITRISKESIFSDLNNLAVVTTTSDKYADAFGFTEEEVFAALDEFGMSDKKDTVKRWYDGFTFGTHTDIYNPWSITNYLEERKTKPYWAQTSSNGLVGSLIGKGDVFIKRTMEDLLHGGSVRTDIDEQIAFNRLEGSNNAVWSLLLAAGYMKVLKYEFNEGTGKYVYELGLTNFEVKVMFADLIRDWFDRANANYAPFLNALIKGDIEEMNYYINDITGVCFSWFDCGDGLSEAKLTERFYHGFVLGLLVSLREHYQLRSNRESGLGRYDIMLEPLPAFPDMPPIIIEFKVFNPKKEQNLEECVQNALNQIAEKNYAAELVARGFAADRIRSYGFAFQGKNALIGG